MTSSAVRSASDWLTCGFADRSERIGALIPPRRAACVPAYVCREHAWASSGLSKPGCRFVPGILLGLRGHSPYDWRPRTQRRSSRRADARGVHVHRDGLWGPIRRVWRVSRKTLNLGILAHVDAGKTILTVRLLFTSGVIDRPGSVDAGTTLTDSLRWSGGVASRSSPRWPRSQSATSTST